ncbi:MAG TPA: LPXTG cell wall anchor domain-containing protein [Rubrobacteraceae bacterium]|nr:LPXTG cell wall anchor domain-containing protein [Rubrobacteraceae bacterium]
MKKLMLLAAMLALVVVAASPAFAQSGSQIEVEEGDVTLEDSTTVEGSILQNCPASVTFGDENENVQEVVSSQNANINIDGSENEAEIAQELVQSGFSPEVAAECTQEIAQAAAAGAGTAEAKAGATEAKAGATPAAEAKAGSAEAKAGGAEAKASPAPAAQAQAGGAKAELPKTGGGASLLALGAGALLVGGGLVARRIIK